MSDKPATFTSNRPAELEKYLEATAEKNDELIVNALTKLEDPKTRGKRKPTVASIQELTGLARNTIRNRSWALRRLKAIKNAIKNGTPDEKATGQEGEDESAILDKLRERIKQLLDQNALLYEEVLSLHRVIERKDDVIKHLSVKKSECNSHKLTRI